MFNIFQTILRNPLLYRFTVRHFRYNYIVSFCNVNTCTHIAKFHPKINYSPRILLYSSVLTWLGLKKEDEEKESELIMTIKRSILCMQRKELAKAEQMLHIALRLAQDQKNKDGITYVYDIMANLALERSQFEKSEKLFVNVLQRLLAEGLPQDDLKVIHISLKLARICQMKREYEKAQIGYLWCLDTIKKHLNDKDAILLNGVIKDWYAQLLTEIGKYEESLRYLEEAYKISSDVEGADSEKSVLLLNDIGAAYCHLGNYASAFEYLNKALLLGRKMDNFEYLAVIYTNLGLLKIKQGMLNEAENNCREGWRIARKENNSEVLGLANYCFEQIRGIKYNAALTNFGASSV